MRSAILSRCFAAITLVSAGAADARQAAVTPQPSNDPAARVDTRPVTSAKDPLAKLFRVPSTPRSPQAVSPNERPADVVPRDAVHSEVVCGMRMWRVDASRDPHIVLPRQDASVDANVRKISPPVCHSPADADASKK